MSIHSWLETSYLFRFTEKSFACALKFSSAITWTSKLAKYYNKTFSHTSHLFNRINEVNLLLLNTAFDIMLLID